MDALVDVKLFSSTDISTPHEEWEKYFHTKCIQSRNVLVEHYLHLTTTLSLICFSRYARYGVSLEDLRQNARLGLIDALDRFDPTRGAKFETFVSFRIKGALLDGLKHYCHDIEIYREVYAKERRESLLPTGKTSGGDLEEWSNSISNIVVSLLLEGEGSVDSNVSGIIDEKYNHTAEGEVLSKQLWKNVAKMKEEHELVILYHYMYGYSFDEISRSMGISKSAAFKRHRSAIDKLRKMQNDDAPTLVV